MIQNFSNDAYILFYRRINPKNDFEYLNKERERARGNKAPKGPNNNHHHDNDSTGKKSILKQNGRKERRSFRKY